MSTTITFLNAESQIIISCYIFMVRVDELNFSPLPIHVYLFFIIFFVSVFYMQSRSKKLIHAEITCPGLRIAPEQFIWFFFPPIL